MADDNSQDLRIHIISDADTTGFKQASAAGKDLRDETDKFNGESLPESLRGWEKFKDRLQENGVEALDYREKLHLLHLTGRSLGGGFEELARMGGLLFNPLTAGAAIGGFALNSIFEHLEKVESKYGDLIAKGQQVNNILREIVAARPSNTEEWIKFTDQIAKLREHLQDSKFAMEQFISVAKGIDENKIKTAFDFEKPGLERKAITDEIANTQAAINQRQRNAVDPAAAQKQADETEERARDLREQITKLPGAISEAQNNAKSALEQSRSIKAVTPDQIREKSELVDFAQNQSALASRFQEMLDAAKAAYPGAANAAADATAQLNAARENTTQLGQLREKVVELTNKLGLFDNLQRDERQHQQVEQVIDYGKGSGNSLGEMAAQIHLTQQQTVTLAERIINGQANYQQVILQLHQRQAQLEAQMQQVIHSTH
jgi:hypothetical protein